MGLFKILKAINQNEDKDKEMDKYNLSKEEKEQVKKAIMSPVNLIEMKTKY